MGPTTLMPEDQDRSGKTCAYCGEELAPVNETSWCNEECYWNDMGRDLR